jgi:hypothetical protein
MKKLTIQEKKDIPFGVKADTTGHKAETSGRTVDIIANTYNYFDSDWDVLAPGCCAKSITERGPGSSLPGKIKHLSNHNLTKGVGRVEVLEETKLNGMDVLHANSWMSETADGEETLQKYKEGLIDQHSIGFRYLAIEFLESESEEFDNVLKDLINPQDAIDAGFMYHVKELRLFEFSSLDGFGANRLTPFLGVKSDNKTVQYNNLIAKLDALLKSDADKDTIHLQTLQIKQMIYELINPEPSLKDTHLEPSGGDTLNVVSEIDKYSLKIN